MKRWVHVGIVVAFLVVPTSGLSQVVEKDEHVNCSTPERTCSVDVTWVHSGYYIIRDEERKNNSVADKETYNTEHILEYYYKLPATLGYDDRALVKWAVLNLYGQHQEFAESGQNESINYEYDGKHYYEACVVQDSPRSHGVVHTYTVSSARPVIPKPNIVGGSQNGEANIVAGTEMRSTRSADGSGTPEYFVWEKSPNRFGWVKSAAATDKARCEDPNFPFGLLKAKEVLPPK